MRGITIKFAAALTSFLIGVAAVTTWVSKPPRRFADDVYFPVGTFAPREGGMNWAVKLYSSSLAAMREPPLSALHKSDFEVYRLVFLPAFDPPVSVRMWRVGGQHYVSVKQLSGPGVPMNGEAIYPKTLRVDSTRPITMGEWEQFQALLREADFWSLPTEDGRPIGLDGAAFLLEGYRPYQYHVVDRWLPGDQKYLDACEYLLRISGLAAGR